MSDSRRRHPPPALSRRRLSPPVTRRSGSSLPPPPPPPPPHWHAPLHQEPTLTGAGAQHSRGPAPPPLPRWLPSVRPAPPGPAPTRRLGQAQGREGGAELPIGGAPPASCGCDRTRRQPVPRPGRGSALRRRCPPALPPAAAEGRRANSRPGSLAGGRPQTPAGQVQSPAGPGSLPATGESRTDRRR